MSTEPPRKRNDKRRKKKEPSDQEKQLQELVFGKDVIAATSERQQSTAVKLVFDKSAAPVAAWEDDEDVEVDLHSSSRLRKLKRAHDIEGTTESTTVSGTEFTQLLQERFQTKALGWAKISSGEDGEDDPDNDLLLRQTGSMVDNSKGTGGPLPQGRLDVRRCMDANAAEPSKDPVTAVKFHPSGRMLMAASEDKNIRFFQIDGDKNEKIMSVRFNEMSIDSAAFLGNGTEVVVGGRKPFFFSYDTTSGAISKIPGLMGKGLKSHEHMVVSPLGTRIAFIGAGGYVHVVCGRQKTWQLDVKMNCPCNAVSFLDEDTLTTSGQDANIYIWDLRHTGRCLNRILHDDGTNSISLATLPLDPTGSTGKGYLAVGAASGVVTLFQGDLRSRSRGVGMSSTPSTGGPAALKSVMNLTTRVTSICFHSSGGAYLAFGENKGRVLLYRLKHFEAA